MKYPKKPKTSFWDGSKISMKEWKEAVDEERAYQKRKRMMI